MTEALVKLKNPETAPTMGQKAYDNFWVDPPTIQKHINRLNDVYQSILSRRSLAEVLFILQEEIDLSNSILYLFQRYNDVLENI